MRGGISAIPKVFCDLCLLIFVCLQQAISDTNIFATQTQRSPVIVPRLRQIRAAQSYREATDPDRVAVLAPDMRRVRAKQQKIAAERAKAASEEAKTKAAMEREKKRVKTPEEERWEKMGGEGSRLGGVADTGIGTRPEVVGGGLRRRR